MSWLGLPQLGCIGIYTMVVTETTNPARDMTSVNAVLVLK